jgi:hypothetical protein
MAARDDESPRRDTDPELRFATGPTTVIGDLEHDRDDALPMVNVILDGLDECEPK